MLGTKRHFQGAAHEEEQECQGPSIAPMFENFRDELDEHHDRRERVVKLSRDITSHSKKIIFSLQRVRVLQQELPPKISKEVQEHLGTIKSLLGTLSVDLQGINSWRYQRQLSPGIQEFVEALTFKSYLQFQRLLDPVELRRCFAAEIELTTQDYVLGIFDLVGELMRFAIATMATTARLPSSLVHGQRSVLSDMRGMRNCMESFDAGTSGTSGLGREVEKKMDVMKACVEKVETAVYGMTVRGRERPKGWIPDLGDRKIPNESTDIGA